MIELTRVSKTYAYPKAVLDDVNLKIGKGEFLYIVGDSGAGKTTLLRMLIGEEKPTKGSVQILGQDLANANSTLLQAMRRRIGVIFQDLRLVEDLSAYDNVVLSLESARDVFDVSDIKRAVEEALVVVGAKAFSKKYVSQLSGGEKQRVAAARAIVRKPEILIADEPTGSLDREHTWGLMDLFQKIHLRGTTVIVATHDREIVRRVRRRSCVLKSGKLTIEDGLCHF